MTVIAASAAPPTSPTPSASSQGAPSGFDALMAIVSAGETPQPKVSAADNQGAAAADKPDPKDDSATSAETDFASKDAETAEAAGQADAAALAAATLVAAMIPQAQQTFAAGNGGAGLDDAPTVTVATPPPLPEVALGDAAATAAQLVASADVPVPTLDTASTDLAGLVPAAGEALAGPAAGSEFPAATSAPAQNAAVNSDGPTAAQAPTPDTPAGVTRLVASLQPATQAATAAEAAAVEAAALPVAEEAPEVAVPMATEVATGLAPVAAQAVAATAKVAPAASAVPADPNAVASDPGSSPLAGVQPAGGSDAADLGAGQGESDPSESSSADLTFTAVTEAASTPDAPVIAAAPTTPIVAPAVAAPVLRAETRGSPETVAQLSADILKKLDAQTTRFDVALTPEGLGKVDVRIEIGRNGALTAHMQFDTVQAAAELRGKAGELRNALSQAGFTVADNALRFDVSSQGGGQNGQNAFFNFQSGDENRRAWSGKAFQSALDDDLPILSASDLLPGLRMAETSGLDIRI